MNVAFQQRSKVVPLKDVADQRAENPMGVLCLQGKFKPERREDEDQSAELYEAGRLYRTEVALMRWVISAPSPFPSSTPTPGSDAVPKNPERIRRSYDEATQALKDAGQAAYLSIVECVVLEREIPDWRVPHLACGLMALARHYRLI